MLGAPVELQKTSLGVTVHTKGQNLHQQYLSLRKQRKQPRACVNCQNLHNFVMAVTKELKVSPNDTK